MHGIEYRAFKKHKNYCLMAQERLVWTIGSDTQLLFNEAKEKGQEGGPAPAKMRSSEGSHTVWQLHSVARISRKHKTYCWHCPYQSLYMPVSFLFSLSQLTHGLCHNGLVKINIDLSRS